MCTLLAMTVAPQLAMCWRLCACRVRTSCDGCVTAACDVSVSLRLQCAQCVGDPALARCPQVAMAVSPQLAMHRLFCDCNVHPTCDDGRTATCNGLAILRLQSAYKLRLRCHRNVRRVRYSVIAMCTKSAMTVALQFVILRSRCVRALR